jgi:hypothetical protein
MMDDLRIFLIDKIVMKCLNEVNANYRTRHGDRARENYFKIIEYKKDKYTEEFIRLVYETLVSWNMDSRGAKLSEFSIFQKSIMNNKESLILLEKYSIENIEKNIVLKDIMKKLFFSLQLVATGKPPLVTFAKTMHFFFNDLIVPIDRKFTYTYFYNTHVIPRDEEKQWEKFIEIEKMYSNFSKQVELKKYLDEKWNNNIPKILDNIIIGYGLLIIKNTINGT